MVEPFVAGAEALDDIYADVNLERWLLRTALLPNVLRLAGRKVSGVAHRWRRDRRVDDVQRHL